MYKPQVHIVFLDNLQEKKELNTKALAQLIHDNLVQHDFNPVLYPVDIEKGSNIEELIHQINRFHYVIFIIDHLFLSIKAALAELALISENVPAYQRIFPVVFPDVKSHKPLGLIDFNYYWDSEINYLKEKLNNVSNSFIIKYFSLQMELYVAARKTVANFASFSNTIFYNPENVDVTLDFVHSFLKEMLDEDVNTDRQEKQIAKITPIPAVNIKQAFDREQRLQNLHQIIQYEPILNLYSSRRSVGKKYLLKLYINNENFLKNYKFVGWIEMGSDLQLDLINQINGKYFDFKIDLEDSASDNFTRLFGQLQNQSDGGFLVIAHAKNIDSHGDTIKRFKKLKNWKLIFLSNEKSTSVQSILFEPLQLNNIQPFFALDDEIYNLKIRDYLLEMIQPEPLLIDFVSKQIVASKRINMLKAYQLVQTAQKNALKQELKNQVQSSEIFAVQVLSLFLHHNFFNKTEILVLQFFALSCSHHLDDKLIIQILENPENEANAIAAALITLAKKGWVLNHLNQYYLAELTLLVIKTNYMPTQQAQLIITDGIIRIINNKQPISYSKKIRLLNTFWSILLKMQHKNKAYISVADYLSNEFLKLYNYESALAIAAEALQVKKAIFPKNSKQLANAYNKVALIYGSIGEINKELEFSLKALFIRKRILPPDHLDLAQSYNNVAISFRERNEYSKAIKYHLRDLKIITKQLNENDTALASSFYETAITYYYIKDYANAEDFIDKAVQIWQTAKTEDYNDLKNALEIQEIIKRRSKGINW